MIQELTDQVKGIQISTEVPERKTIFHDILSSDIPASEKSTSRLTDEATVLVIAGSETTASTLVALAFHLLADRELLSRLKAELRTVMPEPNDPPEAAKLEKLPFLNAVIQETIRMYPGTSHRQDRVAPDEDLVYESPLDGRSYLIPAGTTIGMAAPLVNRNPRFYERPNEFWPDRYLRNPELKKYHLTFSKGARQCIGMDLAYQELQTFIAGIFRRYDIYDPQKREQDGPTMELYQSTKDDITMFADFVTPSVYPGSKGIRVQFRPSGFTSSWF